MALVADVAVQQRRPAGGENSAGRYGGRIDLREHLVWRWYSPDSCPQKGVVIRQTVDGWTPICLEMWAWLRPWSRRQAIWYRSPSVNCWYPMVYHFCLWREKSVPESAVGLLSCYVSWTLHLLSEFTFSPVTEVFFWQNL